MSIEAPSKIVIIGAGPIGIEAALYGRFLGYDVAVFEKGNIADHVSQWKQVELFTPFGMNSTALGRQALQAQFEGQWKEPADDEIQTGQEWTESYLQPLAESDLLAGKIRTQCEVIHVSRSGQLKTENVGDQSRTDSDFEILIRNENGVEELQMAEAVIDCSGVFSSPCKIGSGGPAIGESQIHSADQNSVVFGIPDFETDAGSYENKKILVLGSGFSAATNVVAISRLQSESTSEGPTAVWLNRKNRANPIHVLEEDRLPNRKELAETANKIAAENRLGSIDELSGSSGNFVFLGGVRITAISVCKDSGRVNVSIAGEVPTDEDPDVDDPAGQETTAEIQVDKVIVNTGFQPNLEMIRELQVHQCYASEGPMRLAAQLAGSDSADCLNQGSHGADSLRTSEPNFYILGAKSYGRNSQFLLSVGHQQIRDVFQLIVGRETLDLYAGALKS